MQVTPELNREPLFGQGRSHPSVRCCALRLTDSRLILTDDLCQRIHSANSTT